MTAKKLLITGGAGFIGSAVIRHIINNTNHSVVNVDKLTYQLPPYSQNKLVRAIKGKVLDIVVDVRVSSPTFGQHVAVELTEDNKHQLFIPQGFAHGFVVLSDTAIFAYKVDNYYAPDHDRGIAFNDEQLAIDWRLPTDELQLSDKDKNHPNLSDTNDYCE